MRGGVANRLVRGDGGILCPRGRQSSRVVSQLTGGFAAHSRLLKVWVWANRLSLFREIGRVKKIERIIDDSALRNLIAGASLAFVSRTASAARCGDKLQLRRR